MEIKRPSFSNVEDGENNGLKRPKIEKECNDNNGGDNYNDQVVKFAMPVGFLDPLPPLERQLFNSNNNIITARRLDIVKVSPFRVEGGYELKKGCKQFWKAGDYESSHVVGSSSCSGGMDHSRVHPRFLHSNATSHKWALGALAELLDNALDEVPNGATYVDIDMIINEKDQMLLADQDRNKMLVVQDNGGGMTPDKMRDCMSFGYSAKGKLANTIGQYGNGFKTSSMRLGADVIVFSVCQEKDGTSATRSIGLLSYTFLTQTGKDDILVPMVDYQQKGQVWNKMVRSSLDYWHTSLDNIIKWSPFSSEQELLQQFNTMGNQGTKIIIYNLWEDDEGQLELDFENDPHDIQLRGVNRDEKKIELTRKYPNIKHFLTYQHSLRSYASILYLRLPPRFQIILRGKEVVHHNLENDMIDSQKANYRPVPITDGTVKDSKLLPEDMQAQVTIGFVKAAEDHIDIQGFNVYHKNRLIKPFWRVWNAAGSDGRGVIGVLEANFVEPAHDKQDFEKTKSLQRLEGRLLHLQKNYWRSKCHEIGYAPRRSASKVASLPASLPPYNGNTIRNSVKRSYPMYPIIDSRENNINTPKNQSHYHSSGKMGTTFQAEPAIGNLENSPEIKPEDFVMKLMERLGEASQHRDTLLRLLQLEKDKIIMLDTQVKSLLRELQLEKDTAASLTAQLNDFPIALQLEREKSSFLEAQLEEAKQRIAETDKDHESLILIFSEERERRDAEEEKLRTRLQEASETIEKLLERVKESGSIELPGHKPEHN